MQLKCDEVISRLKTFGMKFGYASLYSDGDYTPEDGIWNYKDGMVHIPYIHHLVENVAVQNHVDSLSSVFLQKIFGFRFPIIVYDYEATKYTQTAISSLFFFVLIVHNKCEEIAGGKTRITTEYNVGAMRPFSFFIPVVLWILRRNYKVLMSTDVPLRERRGQLRKWGYDFPESDYLSVEDIRKDNVKVPEEFPALRGEMNLSDMKDGESRLWGERSDHLGLRVTRHAGQLVVHPRMCPHEGAELDQAACKADRVSCPWHGRAIRALAKFDFLATTQQRQVTSYHELTFAQGQLTIMTTPKAKVKAVGL